MIRGWTDYMLFQVYFVRVPQRDEKCQKAAPWTRSDVARTQIRRLMRSCRMWSAHSLHAAQLSILVGVNSTSLRVSLGIQMHRISDDDIRIAAESSPLGKDRVNELTMIPRRDCTISPAGGSASAPFDIPPLIGLRYTIIVLLRYPMRGIGAYN